MGTPLGRDGCMCGADGYLLAKLVSSYSCALTSGSWRRPWRWPGSSRRVGSQLAGSTRVQARAGCPCVVRLVGAPSPWMLGRTGPMGEDSRRRGRASGLTDRHAERGVLDQLINAVRAGGSRVLVVHGEPGVGKSALLDYLAGRASGCRVARAAGGAADRVRRQRGPGTRPVPGGAGGAGAGVGGGRRATADLRGR